MQPLNSMRQLNKQGHQAGAADSNWEIIFAGLVSFIMSVVYNECMKHWLHEFFA